MNKPTFYFGHGLPDLGQEVGKRDDEVAATHLKLPRNLRGGVCGVDGGYGDPEVGGTRVGHDVLWIVGHEDSQDITLLGTDSLVERGGELVGQGEGVGEGEGVAGGSVNLENEKNRLDMPDRTIDNDRAVKIQHFFYGNRSMEFFF